jgi:hypothetical protein
MSTSKSTTKNTSKSSNPLYVVRKNGVDVEEASGILELLLKKSGLDKMIPLLENIIQIILSEVQTYAVFIEVKKILDQLFEKIIEIIFQIQQLTAKKKV